MKFHPLVALGLKIFLATAQAHCAFNNGKEPENTESIRRDASPLKCSEEASNLRSRWDIIWSCLATIFACTWLAVHPNIPGPQEGQWKAIRTRAKIMFYALITPEFVIGWATNQWLSARMIEKRHKERYKWTKTHAHFLQMGGFILHDSAGQAMRVLSILDLEELERHGAIDWPDITASEIEDRSKSDVLSKGLVILQTSWFIAQCIARGVQGLDLTEIELVTLAFATLNGVMYFLWWNKPLDVTLGTRVHLKVPPNDVAIVLSRLDARFERSDVDGVTSEIAFVSTGHDKDIENVIEKWLNEGPEKGKIGSTSAASASGFPGESPPLNTQRSLFRRSCIHLVSVAWNRFVLRPTTSLVQPLLDMMVPQFSNFWHRFRVPTFYFEFIPTVSGFQRRTGRMFLLYAPGVGTVFGAVHCLAWAPFFTFPSRAEAIIWRTSATIIIVMPSIFAVLVYTYFRFRLGFFVPRFFVMVIFLVYFVARVILLVQPFILLRNLPPGAYQTVQWTRFVPHI